MDFEQWREKLVKEIETAAEWRAEKAVIDPNDPRTEASQKALFRLAANLATLPPEHEQLKALFDEEQELANLAEGGPEEAEYRYREAREELLGAIGFEHDPFENPEQFLDVLRARAAETMTEFRLRSAS